MKKVIIIALLFVIIGCSETESQSICTINSQTVTLEVNNDKVTKQSVSVPSPDNSFSGYQGEINPDLSIEENMKIFNEELKDKTGDEPFEYQFELKENNLYLVLIFVKSFDDDNNFIGKPKAEAIKHFEQLGAVCK